jgi:hypothetical protein
VNAGSDRPGTLRAAVNRITVAARNAIAKLDAAAVVDQCQRERAAEAR